MEATQQHFQTVLFTILFIMLQKVVQILSLWIKSQTVITPMKATEQYFHVVLYMYIMWYKVVATVE